MTVAVVIRFPAEGRNATNAIGWAILQGIARRMLSDVIGATERATSQKTANRALIHRHATIAISRAISPVTALKAGVPIEVDRRVTNVTSLDIYSGIALMHLKHVTHATSLVTSAVTVILIIKSSNG